MSTRSMSALLCYVAFTQWGAVFLLSALRTKAIIDVYIEINSTNDSPLIIIEEQDAFHNEHLN